MISAITYAFATLLHQCLNSIKKGSTKEISLACRAIGMLALTVGEGDNAREILSESIPSIRCFRMKNIEFYSAPTSPKQCKSPIGRTRPNSTIDEFEFEFEFETSSRFNLNDVDFDLEDRTERMQIKQRMQIEDEFLPAIAFADELFSDGKVLPLPPRLKIPPPRNENRSGKSSTVSSPRSPVSALKIKFVHKNLWNDGFDPFLVALQSVKKDGTRKAQANNHGLDPAHRPNNSTEEAMDLQLPNQQPNSSIGPVESPKLFVEPKGLAFARAVVNMEHETGGRFTMSGPILKSNENCRDSKRFSTWKRNKLRKLMSLFGKFGLKSARPTRKE